MLQTDLSHQDLGSRHGAGISTTSWWGNVCVWQSKHGASRLCNGFAIGTICSTVYTRSRRTSWSSAVRMSEFPWKFSVIRMRSTKVLAKATTVSVQSPPNIFLSLARRRKAQEYMFTTLCELMYSFWIKRSDCTGCICPNSLSHWGLECRYIHFGFRWIVTVTVTFWEVLKIICTIMHKQSIEGLSNWIDVLVSLYQGHQCKKLGRMFSWTQMGSFSKLVQIF